VDPGGVRQRTMGATAPGYPPQVAAAAELTEARGWFRETPRQEQRAISALDRELITMYRL
jgi:hypothetical protein